MNIACPRVVIAGTNSGVGKTSMTVALVRALTRRGLRVQPFKVGPDYLDPTYLSVAAGRPCYNLDGWMSGKEYVRNLFTKRAGSADIAVIEGVMGLFDGSDPVGSEGSTAEIAAWLDAPVILVVNVHGLSRSIAALVQGYATFEPHVNIAGVIANHCGSDRHAALLKESLSAVGLPPIVAAVPRGALPELPRRHLGLVTADTANLSSSILEAMANALDSHGSMELILEIAGSACPLSSCSAHVETKFIGKNVRLGISRDAAFHFYYPDNLESLADAGCELVEFSPIADEALPDNLDGLYLGGGYPEEHAQELSRNAGMLESIRRFAAADRPIYAECGGLMYLSQGIESRDGERLRLVGLLPWWTRMLEKRKSLGYVEVTLARDSLFGSFGATLRGHEFHYSEIVGDSASDGQWNAAYLVKHRRTDHAVLEGYQRGRVLASYVHVHFASRPGSVEHFVSMCRAATTHGEQSS